MEYASEEKRGRSMEEKKKTIVQHLMRNGVLVGKELIAKIDDSNIEKVHGAVFSKGFIFSKESVDSLFEKKEASQAPENITPGNVEITYTYNDKLEKKEVSSFTRYFNARYKTIRGILQNRAELSNPLSINRILDMKEKDAVATIGMVFEKEETKNGNIVLTIEDQSSSIKVLINKDKKEIFETAKNIVYDEVIGVTGVSGGKIIFANSLVIPDVPVGKEFKKAKDEVYAAILSDLHVGSSLFLESDFLKFVSWINGEAGNERQREMASKVKYVFIAGDLVDGVGIYPIQQKESAIDDIYGQYNHCAKLLSKIRRDVHLIIIPGNHDAMRLSEPQPMLYKDYAEALWNLPNAIMLTNPAYVNIHKEDGFPGFDILLYHGYSFDYFADNVESIRQKRPNISDRADLVQKFLLQRRHLAPSHTATLYVQDTEKDPLVIERIPDFFISGHIHKAAVSNYRSTTMISGSCFQAKTPFQEKVGHEPEPGRVPLVNLQTREVKMLKFETEKEEGDEDAG